MHLFMNKAYILKTIHMWLKCYERVQIISILTVKWKRFQNSSDKKIAPLKAYDKVGSNYIHSSHQIRLRNGTIQQDFGRRVLNMH